MKLDINEINHNHIVKVVIFALFMYKRQIRNTPLYRISVLKFVKTKIPWKIHLLIETEDKLDKLEEREIILSELLDGVKSDYLTKINVTFTTPLKTVTMEIDLNDEKKYEKFLYN